LSECTFSKAEKKNIIDSKLNPIINISLAKGKFSILNNAPKITIAAGWHGLLAHLLDDKDNVMSFDIDDVCKQTKLFDNVNYKTNDIIKQDPKDSDILICTSCEHMTDDQLLTWIKRRKENSLVILQSNDYFHIKDHINCKASLSQFSSSLIKKAKKKKIHIEITNSYELEFSNYTRFMLFLT